MIAGFRGADLFNPDRYALELIDEASSDLGSASIHSYTRANGSRLLCRCCPSQALVPVFSRFYLGTDPEKIEPVKQAFLDEIHKLSSEGLSPVELARAKRS